MTAISVSAPFPILTDIDGSPLDAGYVYIGQANLDPVAFPKSVYWDASLTTPAAQPIRTSGGYPVRNGSPARIYTDGDYSIRINSKNGTLVYSSPASTDRLDSWQIGYDGGTVQDVLDAVTGPNGAASVGYTPAGTGAVSTTVQEVLRDTVSVFRFLPAQQIAYIKAGDTASQDGAVVTAAIQSAINSASGGLKVIFPPGSYKVTSEITIGSNLCLEGYGATIYKPSTASSSTIFYRNATSYIENIVICGFNFLSINDRTGTGYDAGSLTSNVLAINLSGVKNLSIFDITGDALNYFIKITGSDVTSKYVNIRNVTCTNSRNGLLVINIDYISLRNANLDLTGGGTSYLHGVYADRLTNVKFSDVNVINSAGAALHFYNGYNSTPAVINGVVNNISAKNCRNGVLLYTKSKNITLSNVVIEGCLTGILLNDVSKISINNVVMSDMTDSADRICLSFVKASNCNASNITIDLTGSTASGYAINPAFDVSNVVIDKLSILGMVNEYIFYSTNANITDYRIQNSRFEWASVSSQRISFRGANSKVQFVNNTFINSGTTYSSLVYNTDATSEILLQGNNYKGFTNLISGSSVGTKATRNLNMATWAVDANTGIT